MELKPTLRNNGIAVTVAARSTAIWASNVMIWCCNESRRKGVILAAREWQYVTSARAWTHAHVHVTRYRPQYARGCAGIQGQPHGCSAERSRSCARRFSIVCKAMVNLSE